MNLKTLLLGPPFDRGCVRAQWAAALAEPQATTGVAALAGGASAHRLIEHQHTVSARSARWLRITAAQCALTAFGVPLVLMLLQITPGWWGPYALAGNATCALMIWQWRARPVFPLPALQGVPTGAEQRLAEILASNDLRIRGQVALQRAILQAQLLVVVWLTAAVCAALATVLAG